MISYNKDETNLCQKLQSKVKRMLTFNRPRRQFLSKSKILISVISFIVGYLFHAATLSKMVHDKNEISNQKLPSQVDTQSNESDILLVVLIFSSVTNSGRRQTLRETWLSEISQIPEVKYYFVISGANLESKQKSEISAEQQKFNDLLIFPNLEDSFYLLTSKLVTSFGWLTDTPVLGDTGKTDIKKPFRDFKFVLKCDDDSFVRIFDIVNELKSVFSGSKGENLYWGFFDGRAKVKKTQKYKEDQWEICDFYIPYALGGGYVLGQPLVKFITINEKYLKKYNNEDVSVGAWLANYAGINRVHDPRFDTEYISRGCHQSYLITHKHSELAMRHFHDNLKKTGHLCQKEYKTRMSYIYNWKTVPSKCCDRNNPNIP